MVGRILRLSILSVLLITSSRNAEAATLVVPFAYDTIAEALAAAKDGDVVEIQPGNYIEHGLVLDKNVDLIGVGDDAGDVTIDGQSRGRLLYCKDIEGSPLITRITFRNGRARDEDDIDQSGGAIFVDNCVVIMRDCAFVNNRAEANGGAIRCIYASPTLENCYFNGNSAGGGGGAMDISFGSSPNLQNCIFEHNSASWGAGLSCRGQSNPVVSNCLFEANLAIGDLGYGGGAYADRFSHPVFEHCTFYENYAHYGAALASFPLSTTNLDHCTLVSNNAGFGGAGMFCYQSFPTVEYSIIAFHDGAAFDGVGYNGPEVTNSNFFGNTLGDWSGPVSHLEAVRGNISLDPQFCDVEDGQPNQFQLQESSPCSPDYTGTDLIGAWPVGCEFTSSLLADFGAAWQSEQALLTWAVINHTVDPSFRLTGARQSDPEQEWDIEFIEPTPGHYQAVDGSFQPIPDQVYLFRLYLEAADETWTLLEETQLTSIPLPTGLEFLDAYPNPFNPQTTIRFSLGQAQSVRVAVFDLNGRLVRTLVDEQLDAGLHRMQWQGLDNNGMSVGSGTYLVMIRGRDQALTHKLTLLK